MFFFLGVFYTIILASASFAFDCLLSLRFSTERALAQKDACTGSNSFKSSSYRTRRSNTGVTVVALIFPPLNQPCHSEVAVERVSCTLQRKRDGFGGAKDSRNVLFIRILFLVLRAGFFAVLHFLVAKNCVLICFFFCCCSWQLIHRSTQFEQCFPFQGMYKTAHR